MKLQFFILALIVVSTSLWGQEQQDSLSPRQIRKIERKARPAYICSSIGFGRSIFQDKGTSPLFYKGSPLLVAFTLLKADEKREAEFGGHYSIGSYSAGSSSSTTNAFRVQYSRLFRLNRISNEKWNFKVGGAIDVMTTIRINSSLGNNALGYEVFPTLLGSFKLSYDLSRKEAKEGKFLFIPYRLKPRKMQLSYRIDPGLMNNNIRNNFAYIGHSSILNDPIPFDNYRFNAFAGFRIASSLDFTYYLRNHNGIRFSYLWEAFRGGGPDSRFQMAFHFFRFSLLFNSKSPQN